MDASFDILRCALKGVVDATDWLIHPFLLPFWADANSFKDLLMHHCFDFNWSCLSEALFLQGGGEDLFDEAFSFCVPGSQ